MRGRPGDEDPLSPARDLDIWARPVVGVKELEMHADK